MPQPPGESRARPRPFTRCTPPPAPARGNTVFSRYCGRYYVCPICFTAKNLSPASLIGGAELQGTIPLWEWIGDEAATTFSY
jgi:hypothetical protein